MKTPDDKEITFTYRSQQVPEVGWRWCARLTFAPGSTDGDLAALTVTDGYEKPVPEGTFELAGQAIPVRDGRGEITCAAFVAGKKEPAIWLFRKGCGPVPGILTFE